MFCSSINSFRTQSYLILNLYQISKPNFTMALLVVPIAANVPRSKASTSVAQSYSVTTMLPNFLVLSPSL